MGQPNSMLRCIGRSNRSEIPEKDNFTPPKAVFVLIDPTVKLTDTVQLSLKISLKRMFAKWKLIRGGIFMVFHVVTSVKDDGTKLNRVYSFKDGYARFSSRLDFDKMYQSAETGMRGIQSAPLYDACMELIRLTSGKEFLKHERVLKIFTNGIDGTKDKTGCRVNDVSRDIERILQAKGCKVNIYSATPESTGELFYALQEAIALNAKLRKMDGKDLKKLDFKGNNDYKVGLALLINNRFNGESRRLKWSPRLGADKDTELVREAFRDLTRNEVMVCEDVATLDDLKRVVADVGQRVSQVEPNYVIVIVSSHGKYANKIILNSGEAVDYYKHLVQALKPNSRALEVPQIFLIQACQNSAEADELERPLPSSTRSTSMSYENDSAFKLIGDGYGTSVSPRLEKRFKHQYMIVYATLPHAVAYRDPYRGSVFLQAVCKLFTKGPLLEDLIVAVQEEVVEICKTDGKEQIIPVTKVRFPPYFSFAVRHSVDDDL